MPSRNEGFLIDMSSGGFPWLTLVVFLPLLGVAAILMAEEALAKWVALGVLVAGVHGLSRAVGPVR